MSTGLNDEMVNAALGDLSAVDDAMLDARTVAALKLADVLTGNSPHVDQDFYAELREHFTDGQVLELGSALAVASGWQKFIEAFGIRPDGAWVEQFEARSGR